MKSLVIMSLLGVLPITSVFGFLSAPTERSVKQSSALMLSRRSLIDHVYVSSLACIGALSLPHDSAWASGGATAGGVYLLSAKQRYNDRVKQGVRKFASLAEPLESENIESLRLFFTSEDVGSWKDFSSAGYLLANAFRRNSSAAPDSLPSVKVCMEFDPCCLLRCPLLSKVISH